MSDETCYSTTDWDEICWLLFNEVDLEETVRVGEKQVVFNFQSRDKCERLLKQLTILGTTESRIYSKSLEAIRRGRTILRRTV